MKQILLMIFVVMLSFNINVRSEETTTISNETKTETLDKSIVKASYYGNNYKGKRRTANGDPFDMNAMTCASMTHKFGTLLKVVNIKNGKSVVVRVTDRGQFPKNMVDLTYGAWGKIADTNKHGKPDYRAGILKVKVYILK